MNKNYFISKDNKNGEVVYLEYNKNGYNVKPKVKKEDAIEVSKIVFVSPTLTEKLIKKKINNKISRLLLELNTTYDDESDGGEARFRNMYKEAEKLRTYLMNTYAKYLGKTYANLTLKKLELIINEYKEKLYIINEHKQKEMFMRMFGMNMEEELGQLYSSGKEAEAEKLAQKYGKQENRITKEQESLRKKLASAKKKRDIASSKFWKFYDKLWDTK